jgi:hypothetical protein
MSEELCSDDVAKSKSDDDDDDLCQPPTTFSVDTFSPDDQKLNWCVIFSLSFLNYHPIPQRDSISQPIAPISLVAGGDDTARPRHRG